jgi:hypothetical protein
MTDKKESVLRSKVGLSLLRNVLNQQPVSDEEMQAARQMAENAAQARQQTQEPNPDEETDKETDDLFQTPLPR